ncbi:monocarboxylate transporter 11 isoform X2 [Arvicola amphibius]|uniref:monocarboxylate transporter 11 isoform X2 n=1 Tax=Arvicola amphibius TaxID=1047088 RepID=UPI0018E33E27|nr:monocarboxylate transporter 11 isoform X2 [Arvicola amphibius]
MSEVYRILSNKSENGRTLSGFRDHRYFHAWAAGRARIASRLFLRAQSAAGGSGPCGDLCLRRERVQVGLHLCTGWRLGRTLPARNARRKTSRTHLRPFPTPNAGRGRQTAMTPKPAGPPDGGWGWVVAASAFAVNGLSYGLLRSLGLALPDLAEHFERSAQDTAWVSALALAVQQAASPVGSALSTRWGARPVVMVGGVLTSLGLVFSAFARSLLHLYLGLGLLAGSGWALVFAPSLGTLSRYFSRRRVLAVGLALTGNGASSLLLAPALQFLLDTFGWRGALLLLGAVTLHLTPCGALLRPLALSGDPLAPPRTPLAALGLGLFRRRAFTIFALGTALIGGGYFVPYVHLGPHALDQGMGGYGAALVVAVAAVGDASARLVSGWLADQGWVPLPRLLVVFGSLTGLGVLAVGLVPTVETEEGWGAPLLAAAGAYGLSAGSYAPLVFGVLPGLVGIGGVVQATGLVMMLMSLGGLLGPPLSGFLRDKTGDFSASFLVCSSFILSGSFIYMGLPRALPTCRPVSPPPTPPPERGELLPVPQASLLSAGGADPTRETTC